MNKETRTIVYDDELQIEAYSLNGFVRAFPKHFHEYYVFGLIEGKRKVLRWIFSLQCFCHNDSK